MAKQVLVIDDEIDIREMVKVSLEIVAKFDVLVAASSQEGLALAAAQQPDAILLDVLMPGTNGLMLLQQLQANPDTQNIPVVFLTAKTRSSDQQHMIDVGAKGVITKPFKPVDLAEQLQEILGWNS
ncbi:MAG: response regulator [Thainema sp.]